MQIERAPLREFEAHKFYAEASCIGLPPGQWPETLEVAGLGNGQPFVRTSKKVDADGDMMWVTYLQALGCVSLRVFND